MKRRNVAASIWIFSLAALSSCSSVMNRPEGRSSAAAGDLHDFVEKSVDRYELVLCEDQNVTERDVRTLIEAALVEGFRKIFELNPKIRERVHERLDRRLEITCRSLDGSEFISYGGATRMRFLAKTHMSLPFVLDGLSADLPRLKPSLDPPS